MSDIRFNCPSCEHSLVVDAEGAGMQVPCPKCRTTIVIPAAEAPAKPPAPPMAQAPAETLTQAPPKTLAKAPSEQLHGHLKEPNPVLAPSTSAGLASLHVKSKADDDGEQHGEDINVDQPFAKKKDQWFTTNHGKKYHFCYYNSHGRMMETACGAEHMPITAEIMLDLGKPRKGAYCKDCLNELELDVNDLV